MNYAYVHNKKSATGTRTWVARVRAEHPNQLDYSGVAGILALALSLRAMLFSALERMSLELRALGNPTHCLSLYWHLGT